MIKRAILRALYGVMIGLAASSAIADDDAIPKPDPVGWWRVIHVDDARSTSKCVGNPITPLCVAETWMGCHVRRDQELCRMADPKYDDFGRPFPKVARTSIKRYRILSADRLTRKTIPKPTYENDSSNWRPGDIRIMILKVNCTVFDQGEYCFTGKPDPEGFIIRRVDDRWILADTVSPPRITR